MARRTRVDGPTKQVLIRMPEALWVHIKDQAQQHNRTFNAEVVHLLIDPRRQVYQEIRKEIREKAEDLYGEDWWYAKAVQPEPHPETPTSLDEVEWLNPGGRWETQVEKIS